MVEIGSSLDGRGGKIELVFMKKTLWRLAAFSFLVLPLYSSPIGGESIKAYFSPQGGCTEAIVKEVNAATNTVLVQAYSFTSAPIAKAIADAKKRGLDVAVILDKSQRGEKYSSADFFVHEGVPTFIDAVHRIAHNKVMVIDGNEVITGSFNFTKSAEESNAENLLVITHAQALAGQYAKNWKLHMAHSGEYKGRNSLN